MGKREDATNGEHWNRCHDNVSTSNVDFSLESTVYYRSMLLETIHLTIQWYFEDEEKKIYKHFCFAFSRRAFSYNDGFCFRSLIESRNSSENACRNFQLFLRFPFSCGHNSTQPKIFFPRDSALFASVGSIFVLMFVVQCRIAETHWFCQYYVIFAPQMNRYRTQTGKNTLAFI